MKSSETIGELSQSLVKVQAEIKNPANSAKANIPTKKGGSFSYRYAPLPDILSEVRPLLTKYGLAVLQWAGGDGKSVTITTILVHESGEWLQSNDLTLIAEGTTAQAVGSVITYGRRYTLASVLGISSEDDDDGAVRSTSDFQNPPLPKPKPHKEEKEIETAGVSKGQLKKIFGLIDEKFIEKTEAKKELYEKFDIESTTQLTKEQAHECIEWLDDMEDVWDV